MAGYMDRYVIKPRWQTISYGNPVGEHSGVHYAILHTLLDVEIFHDNGKKINHTGGHTHLLVHITTVPESLVISH